MTYRAPTSNHPPTITKVYAIGRGGAECCRWLRIRASWSRSASVRHSPGPDRGAPACGEMVRRRSERRGRTRGLGANAGSCALERSLGCPTAGRPSASSRAAAARMRWRMDRWAGGPAEVGRRAGPSSDGARSGGKCSASTGARPWREASRFAVPNPGPTAVPPKSQIPCWQRLADSHSQISERQLAVPSGSACLPSGAAGGRDPPVGRPERGPLASLLGEPGRQDALGAACAAPGSGRLRCGSRLPRPARALRTRYRMDQPSAGRNAAQAASAATVKPAHPPPHGCAPLWRAQGSCAQSASGRSAPAPTRRPFVPRSISRRRRLPCSTRPHRSLPGTMNYSDEKGLGAFPGFL